MRTEAMAALAMLALAACQSPAPQTPPDASAEAPLVTPARTAAPADELTAEYAGLRDAGAAVWRVDPSLSDIRIHVYRGGRLARVGHNHVLSAPAFTGYVVFDGSNLASARFDLRFAFAALTIDDPALRVATGGNFAGERSQSDIEGTRDNMLGPRVLDAQHYPELCIRSLRIEGDLPLPITRIAVDWHGVTREHDVLLQLENSGDRLRASGDLVLRQSDHGITPLSILAGAIAVQDPVGIRFTLEASRWR